MRKILSTDIQHSPESKKSNRIKILIVLGCILLIAGIIISISAWNSTAWERDFEIQYVGLDNALGGRYTYKIKNRTNNAYKNVKAVFHVTNIHGDFLIEDYIGSFKQGEEVEYSFYCYEVENEAEKKGIELFLYEVDLERLVW